MRKIGAGFEVVVAAGGYGAIEEHLGEETAVGGRLDVAGVVDDAATQFADMAARTLVTVDKSLGNIVMIKCAAGIAIVLAVVEIANVVVRVGETASELKVVGEGSLQIGKGLEEASVKSVIVAVVEAVDIGAGGAVEAVKIGQGVDDIEC